MAKTFEWLDTNDLYYDAYLVFEDGVRTGAYLVPEGITGQEYDDALDSATTKLFALGFTELEIQALIGRQLF
jgi:hypothetical protein